jgi:hypothetical protein
MNMRIGLLAAWGLVLVNPVFAFGFPLKDSKKLAVQSLYHPTELHLSKPTGGTLEASKTEAVTDEIVSTDALICGGGPAGLLSAIMLAQKFPDVSCGPKNE